MLKATLVGTQQVERDFSNMPGFVLSKLERVTEKFCIDLSGRVKARKLSGQVLKVRTGRLRRSIHHEMRKSESRVVGAVGTNVIYGKYHEHGGTFQMPSHNRLVTKVFGRPTRFPVWQTVKAHDIRFPERSFLRSAYAEMRGEYVRRVDKTVRDLSKR